MPPPGASTRAGEPARLVALLSSHDAVQADTARAMLRLQGARAVAPLLELLEGGGEAARECAMDLLSDIRDSRAREPIIAQLHDRAPRIRIAAARALATLPAPCTVAPLRRALSADPSPQVRIAAAQSLITHFESGFEEVMPGLLDKLFQRGEEPAVRLAAAGVLSHLRPRERRDVLASLAGDATFSLASAEPFSGVPSPGVAASGGSVAPDRPARGGRPARNHRSDLDRWIGDLAAPGPDRWNAALRELTALGPAVIEPLVDGMCWRAEDPVYCGRAGMVLRRLGPRRLRPIADYLDRVTAPLPLETLVDVLGELEDKPLIYRLRDLIVRLQSDSAPEQAAGPRAYDRVIAKAHLQLAKIGSRVAVDDLKDALRSPHRPLQVEQLAAVELIGKKDDLVDLMHAWGKGDPWMRARVQEVFLSVMRRERVRRTNRLFSSLSPGERAAFEVLMQRPARPARPARRS